MASLDLDSELGRLYGAELGSFVAERTQLARSLRAEGRRAEAATVEELRKPSLVLWTVNQLGQRNRKDMERLLDAGDRLGAEQVALLGGRGDSNAFDEARKGERHALARLRQAASEILGERASAGTLDRVVATLRAAAVSGETREALAHGRLKDEVAPVGFEAFAGITPASTTARGRVARDRATKPVLPERSEGDRAGKEEAQRQAISRARATLKAARERETTVAEELRGAERALRGAREKLEVAERTAVRLRAEREAAAVGVEAARSALDTLRPGGR